MHKRNPALPKSPLNLKRLFYLGVMLLLLYVIVPRLPGFLLSWNELLRIHLWWVAASTACFSTSFMFSAGVYHSLSSGRLPYKRTVIVQVAATFLDRLLPAGSGAFGVSYLYARKQRFNNAGAIALVAANNLLGFIGHMLLLLGIIIFFGGKLAFLNHLHLNPWSSLLLLAGLVTLTLAFVLLIPQLREPVKRNGLEVVQTLVHYWRKPSVLLRALGFSLALTLTYVASLYCAAQAVGLPLTPLEAFIVMTVGVAAGTFIPTPGGLGGAEAGLVAGLIGFSASAHQALEVALLFRFVTFWLAIAFGVVAFAFIERRGIIDLASLKKG